MGLFDNISAFDAFSRTDAEFRVRTRSGAIISLVALSLMALLFVTELSIYLTSDIKPELYVDTSLGESIQINLDVTFHALPCAFISVNVMDKTGNHQLNVHDNIYLDRLDKQGNKITDAAEREIVGSDKHQPDIKLGDKPTNCGNCYGADSSEMPCCNTCNDVQEAYRRKGWAFTSPQGIEQCVKEGFMEQLKHQKEEMCRVRGYLRVARVAGNVNIVPGKFIMQNARYVLDTQLYEFDGSFNISHTIHHLSFGLDYPGMKNPLDGVTKTWPNKQTSAMYEYFVKVVPTIYQDLRGNSINTNQFSVTEYVQSLELHSMNNRGVPGFFVMYDLSPIIVDYKESSKSFLHFLVNLCAIIGGVFTVASLIDSFVFSGLKTLKKKIELGKAS